MDGHLWPFYQQHVTQKLIKKEIDRFNEDFSSGKAIPLFESCLPYKYGAFDHCKSSAEGLLYTVNSKTFNDTLNEYNIDLFCDSLEKHKKCMQKQANLVCSYYKHGKSTVPIDLPADSLCSNQIVARLNHTFSKAIQMGIVVDFFVLVLLLIIWLYLRSQQKNALIEKTEGEKSEQENGNREGLNGTSEV